MRATSSAGQRSCCELLPSLDFGGAGITHATNGDSSIVGTSALGLDLGTADALVQWTLVAGSHRGETHTASALNPRASRRRWAAVIKDARLIVLAGVGHSSWLESPRRAFDVTDTFRRGEWPAGSERAD